MYSWKGDAAIPLKIHSFSTVVEILGVVDRGTESSTARRVDKGYLGAPNGGWNSPRFKAVCPLAFDRVKPPVYTPRFHFQRVSNQWHRSVLFSPTTAAASARTASWSGCGPRMVRQFSRAVAARAASVSPFKRRAAVHTHLGGSRPS